MRPIDTGTLPKNLIINTLVENTMGGGTVQDTTLHTIIFIILRQRIKYQ